MSWSEKPSCMLLTHTVCPRLQILEGNFGHAFPFYKEHCVCSEESLLIKHFWEFHTSTVWTRLCSNMDIANKTRCFRQSKRFDLFSGQWEEKRFLNHRKKVENAAPRIDFQTPKSASFQHMKVHNRKFDIS